MKKWIGSILSLFLLFGCAQPASQKEGIGYVNYDREVFIDSTPQKVLTFGPNCTELFCALNLEDVVIGSTLNNHFRQPLPEYEEKVANIPQLNYGSATREAVFNSGADFIYGIDWEFGEEGIRYDELEQFGITAYTNQASSIEEEYREIEAIGQIFGVEEEASALIKDQKERIQAIQEKASHQEPIRVLVYDSGGNGIFTATGSNFESRLIEAAGAENLFADIQEREWTTVSTEEAAKREPDVIVVHDYDVPSLEEKIAAIKNDPALSQLKAVQNNRFIPISLESVLPGPRMAYAIETLYRGFYE